MLPDVPTFALLGFTARWAELGLVDDALLARFREEWERGDDHSTEHYRYRAFGDFLAARRPLAPELAMALYELGDSDADHGMGGAMMAVVLHLPECPPDVLNRALASDRPHLVRAARQRARAGGGGASGAVTAGRSRPA